MVVFAYLLALAAAWFVISWVSEYPVLVQVFIAYVVATFVIFAFSVLFRNSSFYDPYWSVIPIVLVGYFAWLSPDFGLRHLLVGIVILGWGLRLTGNWLYTWRGLDHEDWRYVMLREQTGILWWPVSLTGVHLVPTVVVFLGCIPLYAALVTGDRAVNLLDGVAFVVGMLSIWLEYRADVELHRFRAVRTSRAEVLDQGLWGLCRHPNYLGELGIWVSAFLFGYAALGEADAWMISGPVVMFILFLFISIPMIEKKLLADKPGYEDYRQRTFMLLPIPRARSRVGNGAGGDSR